MTDRRVMRELVAPERAREVIAGFEPPDRTETVALAAADGRVLAEPIDATIDVPGFDRAAMDGYAVRAADTTGAGEADPVELDLVGTLAAGEAPSRRVEPGTAVEIATGAVLPAGADAVAIVERCERRGDTVDVGLALPPGANVTPAGDDVAAGDRALSAGTRLAPRTLGLLAAIGRETIPVRGTPRVGVVSTGAELVAPGADLDPMAGEIYDVNGTTIATAIREAGGDPVTYGTVPDDPDRLRSTLDRAAADCDLVVTSGSTSAGSGDVLYRIVAERGDLVVHGVAIKPGKPTIVGRYDGTPLVGLPGYPVSAQSIFRLLVAPTLRAWTGTERETATVDARLAISQRYDEGRHRALPVGLVADGDGDPVAYPVDRGSGATTSLAYADGVVEMDADTRVLPAGEPITVERFSTGDRPPALLAVGESDPGFAAAIEGIDATRYRTVGTAGGRRWLRDGIADVGVLAGDLPDGLAAKPIGGWTREWGLVLAEDVGIDALEALAAGPYRFVNRDRDAGLRTALEDAIDDCGDPAAIREGIDGYDAAVPGVASPARRIDRGDADAGLGLRAAALEYGLEFLSLGHQRVTVLAAPARREKSAVERLATVLADGPPDLPGYDHA